MKLKKKKNQFQSYCTYVMEKNSFKKKRTRGAYQTDFNTAADTNKYIFHLTFPIFGTNCCCK